MKMKTFPNAPEFENGLIQMIRMGKSIHHKWVKFRVKRPLHQVYLVVFVEILGTFSSHIPLTVAGYRVGSVVW